LYPDSVGKKQDLSDRIQFPLLKYIKSNGEKQMKILILGTIAVLGMTVILGIIGLLLPKYKEASGEIVFDHNKVKVWKKMRNLQGQKEWRKEISSIEILDNSWGKEKWIEKTKTGAQIKLMTIRCIEGELWSLETFDSPMLVSWIGTLKSLNETQTLVMFRYKSKISNPYLRILSLPILNLNEMIETYSLQLKSALEKK